MVLRLAVGFVADGLCVGVDAPLFPEGSFDLFGVAEFEVADFLRNDGAFGFGLQSGDEFGLESASLLRVEVANFFRHVDEGVDRLIVALFGSLLDCATLTAKFDGQFLALSVADKFTRRLFDITSGARRLVEGFAFLVVTTTASTVCRLSRLSILGLTSAATAPLLQRSVALLHGFRLCHLFEGDLASFLKVFVANFFLSRLKLGDISVVAFFDVFVRAFEDGIFLQGVDRRLFVDAAQTGFGVVLATAKVYPVFRNLCLLLASSPSATDASSAAASASSPVGLVGADQGRGAEQNDRSFDEKALEKMENVFVLFKVVCRVILVLSRL